MTLGQLKNYILTAKVPMQLLQSTHYGHTLIINGHGVTWSPNKLSTLDKKSLDELIEKNYILVPEKTPKKKWDN